MSILFEAERNRAVEQFFAKIAAYHPLSADATLAWMKLLSLKKYRRGDFLVRSGQAAKNFGFVSKGLFSQYIETADGAKYIKRFFAEGYFVASVPSLLTKCPSSTSIEALEHSTVLEYDFRAFKDLAAKFPDVLGFYVAYVERHWIVEKEPIELALRQFKSRDAFENFSREHGHILHRLKKQDIAAYLGITPTQMSRILTKGGAVGR